MSLPECGEGEINAFGVFVTLEGQGRHRGAKSLAEGVAALGLVGKSAAGQVRARTLPAGNTLGRVESTNRIGTCPMLSKAWAIFDLQIPTQPNGPIPQFFGGG